MKTAIYIGLIIIALSLSFNAVSYAKLTFTPSLTIREQYDDNIFLDHTDEEDDFITIVVPNILFDYSPNRYFDVNLDYRLNFRFYSDNDELNLTSLEETQEGTLTAQARPFNHVYIDVYDVYRRVQEDIRTGTAADNEVINRTGNNIFRVSPYTEIPLTTSLKWRVGYRYANIWYEADDVNESESNSAYTALIKKFPAGLQVSLNYDYSAVRPENTNKYDLNQGSVAAHYQAASNVAVWGEIGRAYLDFVGRSDQDVDFWNLGAEYKIDALGNTIVTAMYSQMISETETLAFRDRNDLATSVIESRLYMVNPDVRERYSVRAGASKVEEISLEITTGKNIQITVYPYYAEYDELESDREDKEGGIKVRVVKPLTTKLTASFNGYWKEQKYEPEDEVAREYSLSPSFDYLVSRSITAGVGYRYNKRDFSIDTDDYHNNIIWVQAKVTF